MKIWRKRLTHSLNDEAVFKTAPATPGLLIKSDKVVVLVGGGFVINGATPSSFTANGFQKGNFPSPPK